MAKAWLRLADYVELRQRERLSQHRQDLPQTNSPVRKDQRGGSGRHGAAWVSIYLLAPLKNLLVARLQSPKEPIHGASMQGR